MPRDGRAFTLRLWEGDSGIHPETLKGGDSAKIGGRFRRQLPREDGALGGLGRE